MIEQQFRQLLIDADFFDNSDGVGRIQYNTVDETAPTPRIWFVRRSSNTERLLNGDAGIKRVYFDLEIVCDTVDEMIDIADNVKDLLDGYRGTMGNSYALGIFVADHSDDYVPRNDAGDEGLHIASLDIEVIPCDEGDIINVHQPIMLPF